MSGICPTPPEQIRTVHDDPEVFYMGVPDAALNDCDSVINTDMSPPDPECAPFDHTHVVDDITDMPPPCEEGLAWKGIWADATAYKTLSETACAQDLVSHVADTGDADWADATVYVVGDAVYDSNHVNYTCTVDNTSDPTTEPGVGASWETKWIVTPDSALPHALYTCILDHTSTPSDDPVWGVNGAVYWELVLKSGGGSTPNVGIGTLNYKGVWIDTDPYVVGDIVNNHNSSYVCILAHTAKSKESGVEGDKGNEPTLDLIDQNSGIVDTIFDDVAEFVGEVSYNDAAPYWELLSKGEQEDQGYLGGLFDWLGDVTGWEILDNAWVQGAISLLGAGAISYYLGEYLEVEDPQYDVRYDTGADDSDPDNQTPEEIQANYFGYIGAYTKPTLQQAVSSICDDAGIQNYDVTALPNVEVSFALSTISSYRSALEMLSQAYQFDIINTFLTGTGRLIAFRPHNTTSVATLSLSDVGYGNGTSGNSPFNAKRLQGVELPHSVEISYYSSVYGEKDLTQKSTLRTYPQGQEYKLSIPMSMDDDEVKKLADVILTNAHLERSAYSFTTSIEHIELEAGDIVTLETVGDVRISSVTSSDESDGLLEFTAVDSGVAADPQPIYDGPTLVGYTASSQQGSILPSGPIVPDYTESVSYLTQSGIIPLDLPALNNNDKDPRMHVLIHDYGFTPEGASWAGAQVEVSRDDGATWEFATQSNGSSGTWGIVPTLIPAPSNWNVIDETTVITVDLKTDSAYDLAQMDNASTNLDLYNGLNKCMIGQELIYYRDFNDLGGGVVELSGLLRGRKGTDVYTDAHVDDEVFVLLTGSGFLEIPLTNSDFRKPLKFRVQTNGLNIEDAPLIDVAPQFMNIKGWSVFNGTIGKDGATKMFAGRFLRRYKWDSELVNGRSNYADEDLAGYKVAIINPVDDSDIKREYVITAPQFTYSLDQQIEDFGVEQSTLKVSVVPISKTIGPGQPTIITYGI